MYLARYEIGERQLVQGRVGFSSRVLRFAQQWLPVITPLVSAQVARTGIWASVRVTIDGEGVSKILSLAVPLGTTEEARAGGGARESKSDGEQNLRRWLAGFTRIERLCASEINLPRDAGEHDRLTRSLPGPYCRITCSGFRHKSVWFACSYSLVPVIDRLLTEASAAGHCIAWQVNMAPFVATADMVRNCRRNALLMNGLPGASSMLVHEQDRIAKNLVCARYLTEEYLAVSDDCLDWAQDWLGNNFDDRYKALGYSRPDFEFGPICSEEELNSGLHLGFVASEVNANSADSLELDSICGSAVSADGAAAILSWTPRLALAPFLDSGPSWTGGQRDDDDDRLGGNSYRAPRSPRSGPGSFVFVSYSHSDSARIAPIIEVLLRAGIDLWWDADIPGGVEWDEHLEERLNNCHAVLLMLSQRAVDSKYVRREVKYADAIDKRVITVVLGKPVLRYGLNMMLGRYQMLDGDREDLVEHLAQALSVMRH